MIDRHDTDHLYMNRGYSDEEEASVQRRSAEIYQESLTDGDRGAQVAEELSELNLDQIDQNALFDALLSDDKAEFGRLLLEQYGLRERVLKYLRDGSVLSAEAEMECGA